MHTIFISDFSFSPSCTLLNSFDFAAEPESSVDESRLLYKQDGMPVFRHVIYGHSMKLMNAYKLKLCWETEKEKHQNLHQATNLFRIFHK